MPGESYRRQLRSLLLYLCDVYRVLINSLVCCLNILNNPLSVSPMQFPPYHCEIPWRRLILFSEYITDSLFGDWCIHPSMRHSQEPSLSVSLVQFNFGLSLSATPEAVFKDISFILFWETDVRPRMRRFLKNPLCESQPCIPRHCQILWRQLLGVEWFVIELLQLSRQPFSLSLSLSLSRR